MQPGLDALIHPCSRDEFVAAYAANQPFVVHNLGALLDAVHDVPSLSSLDALLAQWPSVVQAHLPDVADEVSSVDATPHDARKLFDAGFGLRFDDAHRLAPVLGQWLEALRADVGLSALTHARCLVYATPAGKGTAPHFDQNVNFVVQLHGTKTWSLAENQHVDQPLTRHTMGLPMDPELATYVREPMPSTMPTDSRDIVLTPGSLLFVPRGMWHATHTDHDAGDALSLNFTYSPPTWIDLLTAALRGRLALSAAWRQTANPDAPAEFDALLAALAVDATTWTAQDILDVTEAADDTEADA